jgi:hypothetical protein
VRAPNSTSITTRNHTLHRRNIAPQGVARLVWVAWDGGWKQVGGTSGGEPTCLKPYPKALFVSSSSLCQHPGAPALQPATIDHSMAIEVMQEKLLKYFLRRFMSAGGEHHKSKNNRARTDFIQYAPGVAPVCRKRPCGARLLHAFQPEGTERQR